MIPDAHDAVIPLPSEIADGLDLLFARVLRVENGSGVRRALFGDDVPAFGSVRETTAEDLSAAASRSGGTPPVTATRDAAKLCARLTAKTPHCPSCGELPLAVVGGRVQALEDGAACPFCGKDTVLVVPILLRRLSWLTGALVPPNQRMDATRFRGAQIPLFGADLRVWSGGRLHADLEHALRDARIPLYALLAHVNAERKLLPTGSADVLRSSVEALCRDPGSFRLDMADAARAARRLLESKEVVNVTTSPTPDAPRVKLGDNVYRMEGRVGEGETSLVYRAVREDPLPMRVILKASKRLGNNPFRGEIHILDQLAKSSARGTPFFALRLLPEVVDHDFVVDMPDGSQATVLAYRDRNLFDWTLADVIREYPEGIEPQAMAWMWNRLLTLLTWLHSTGVAHGAIVPEHVLLHVPIHGALLLDWSYAATFGKPLNALPGCDVTRPGNVASAAADVTMSARCMIKALGGDPASGDLPGSVPRPIAEFLRIQAWLNPTRLPPHSAADVETRFEHVTKTVYGPRKYRPFHMPRPSQG